MFLIEPSPTPYDLQFRFFGTPVRVHPMFWLVSLLLGWPQLRDDMRHLVIPFALIWVACTFVSILIHEMGHILAGRIFGANGYVVLYSFGGLAVGSNALRRGWQRALVSFAGPFAQFVLFGITLAVYWAIALTRDEPLPLLVEQVFRDLLIINLFWPILNLLPIWPLDGGQISREIWAGVMPERGPPVALGLSMLLAGLLAVNGIVLMQRGTPLVPVVGRYVGTSWFSVIFFGMLALGSFQALQQVEHERRWQDEHWDRWER